MSIIFQKPGILTTLQDLGRYGYRRFGINPNGVMDILATRLINNLLGNHENEAVLEMHFPAPQVLFEANAIIAIGGADFAPMLDGEPLQNWRPHFVRKGSLLKFADRLSGNRAYLAVHGGFKTKLWLGSASTNLLAETGGYNGRAITSGDRLALRKRVESVSNIPTAKVSTSLLRDYDRARKIRVIAGAEYDLLNEESKHRLIEQNFRISSDSGRMGYRLSGEPILLKTTHEMVSVAVNFGTIQALPDGQLIVLMADQQTSGGYPRIAHVISCDLPLLAQLSANDTVAFNLITLRRAEQLKHEFENNLNFFRIGCKFQTQSWNL